MKTETASPLIEDLKKEAARRLGSAKKIFADLMKPGFYFSAASQRSYFVGVEPQTERVFVEIRMEQHDAAQIAAAHPAHHAPTKKTVFVSTEGGAEETMQRVVRECFVDIVEQAQLQLWIDRHTVSAAHPDAILVYETLTAALGDSRVGVKFDCRLPKDDEDAVSFWVQTPVHVYRGTVHGGEFHASPLSRSWCHEEWGPKTVPLERCLEAFLDLWATVETRA